MVRASAEILFHSIKQRTHSQKLSEQIQGLEQDNKKMSKELKDVQRSHSKLQNDYDNDVLLVQKTNRELQAECARQDALLEEYFSKSKTMTEEIDAFHAREQSFLEEKKKSQEAYTEGSKGLLKGFLAVEPSYDWKKFGQETANWMENFKITKADEIAAKKAKIEAMKEPLQTETVEALLTEDEVRPLAVDIPETSKAGEERLLEEDSAKEAGGTS